MSEQEEQQTEKKKAGIAKSIFKWLGLGLVTLLLAVSIIFQASWKIITLLAIIFLACTVLPKAHRKYFWLSVGGAVIALIVWVFLPEKDEGWRPYTFDEELAELQAKYAIPDEENAAIIYNQLLEDYNKAEFGPNFSDPNLEDLIRTEFWSSEDYPEATQWIERHKDTITKLIEAAEIEQCRFPIIADFMRDDITNRLASMRRWAYLLVSAANNDAAEGRANQAIEKYIALIQMGKHQRQQPALIDMLVGIGIEDLPLRGINRFVVEDNAKEEYLSIIEKAIAEIKYDWRYDWPRMLDFEKLFAKNVLQMFYEVNEEGKVRLSHSVRVGCEGQCSQKIPALAYWEKKLKIVLAWFYMPSTPQKAGEIIDTRYGKFYAMANPDFYWQKGPEKSTKLFWMLNFRYLVELWAGMLEPAYYSIHNAYLRAIAQQRGSRIIIALRRYKNENGNWPGSLDEIKSSAPEEIFTDPINGGSFVYKLTEENFTLYSNGKNGIDDGGKQDKGDEEETGADDLLIWSSEEQ